MGRKYMLATECSNLQATKALIGKTIAGRHDSMLQPLASCRSPLARLSCNQLSPHMTQFLFILGIDLFSFDPLNPHSGHFVLRTFRALIRAGR